MATNSDRICLKVFSALSLLCGPCLGKPDVARVGAQEAINDMTIFGGSKWPQLY